MSEDLIPQQESKKSISEKLDSLVNRFDKIDERLQKKKFKLPRRVRASKSKIKKNYVVVLLLRTNGQATFKLIQIENDMIEISENETFHLASTDYVYRYGKYPLIVLAEWSLRPIPINFKEYYEKVLVAGETSWPQKVIINAVLMSQLKQKKKFAAGAIIVVVIAVIAGIFVLSEVLK